MYISRAAWAGEAESSLPSTSRHPPACPRHASASGLPLLNANGVMQRQRQARSVIIFTILLPFCSIQASRLHRELYLHMTRCSCHGPHLLFTGKARQCTSNPRRFVYIHINIYIHTYIRNNRSCTFPEQLALVIRQNHL